MTRADHALLRFPCPQCCSWLQAPRQAAGTRRRCPRCQFVLDVPRESRTPADTEAYAFSAGLVPAETSAGIWLTCPVCRTRMHATAGQIGRELKCPDCGHASVVPPPEPPPQQKAARPAVEEYPLCEEVAGPLDANRRDAPMIRLYCGVCGTMMYATEAEVGKNLVCPDCGTATEVKRSERPAKKPPPSAGGIGEYPLAAQNVEATRPARGRKNPWPSCARSATRGCTWPKST